MGKEGRSQGEGPAQLLQQQSCTGAIPVTAAPAAEGQVMVGPPAWGWRLQEPEEREGEA